MSVSTYLFYDGNCEAAFKFYEKVLGGKIVMMMTHEGAPAEMPIAPEWRSKIMHARMEIGHTVLMASDSPPPHFRKPQGFSVSIGVDTPAEAERIFGALADGGAINMPIQETFWAQRFGMLIDPFGIPWMVNCDKPA